MVTAQVCVQWLPLIEWCWITWLFCIGSGCLQICLHSSESCINKRDRNMFSLVTGWEGTVNWKGCGEEVFGVSLRYCPGIYPKGLLTPMKSFSQKILCPSRDLRWAHLEHKSESLHHEPTCSDATKCVCVLVSLLTAWDNLIGCYEARLCSDLSRYSVKKLAGLLRSDFMLWPTKANSLHSQSRDMALPAVYFIILYYHEYSLQTNAVMNKSWWQ
jgi:hypothetical protein